MTINPQDPAAMSTREILAELDHLAGVCDATAESVTRQFDLRRELALRPDLESTRANSQPSTPQPSTP